MAVVASRFAITDILPRLLARGLMVLRKKCIMPRLVNSDYSLEAARKGATIDIPIPTAVAPGTVPDTNVSAANPTLVQVPLNHWQQNKPIVLTDKDMQEIDLNEHFLPMQMAEAIKALASDVNVDILAQYSNASRGVYGYVGTAGTTPFGDSVGVSTATQARKILNKQLCPVSDRRGVLDFDAEAAALDLSAFSDAEKTMSAIVKMEGEIGRKYGIDWVADDDVPLHTAGTIVDDDGDRECSVNNGGGYSAGTSTIAVDADQAGGDTMSGTVVVGDIISFAGHTQTYCVIGDADYTIGANAIAALQFYPALKEAVADNEVITVKASHRVNLVFHRDAFAFATRALEDANSLARIINGGSQILSMQDPQTGLVLRLEVSRQHKQTVWEYDILWGAELIRPELACRVAG